ncbi:MAG: VOC family protein [Paracoccaceae bacterium]
MTAPGRPVWLELNAQRVTQAMAFYRELFAWGMRPLHVPPWGSIPLIGSGERVFANQFMAMGAFATPVWMCRFSGDLPRAVERIAAGCGHAGNGIERMEGFAEQVNGRDPTGIAFTVINLLNGDVPDSDNPGEPCAAELWSADPDSLAPFYGDVFGLEVQTTEQGAVLLDGDAPRLSLRRSDYEIAKPHWIPLFRTAGLGGDVERARRLGAVVQVHEHDIPGMGRSAILADPANAYFGLLEPQAPRCDAS